MVKSTKYLLDSDILIAMLRDRGDTTGLRSRALQAGLDNCFVSSISMAELYSGAYRMQSERGLHELEFVKAVFGIIPFGAEGKNDFEIFGQSKAILSKSGTPLDDMDLLIGATALAHGLTLVTHNLRHFSRIPKLKVEDWLNM